MSESYTIGELAAEAGVHIETIRYYQRRDLFPKPARVHGRVRRYGVAEVRRLRFMKSAQRLGFTLSEVNDLMELTEQVSCSKTKRLAAAKLREIEQRIWELQKLRSEFERVLSECDANADESSCPMIDRLKVEAERSPGFADELSQGSARVHTAENREWPD